MRDNWQFRMRSEAKRHGADERDLAEIETFADFDPKDGECPKFEAMLAFAERFDVSLDHCFRPKDLEDVLRRLRTLGDMLNNSDGGGCYRDNSTLHTIGEEILETAYRLQDRIEVGGGETVIR